MVPAVPAVSEVPEVIGRRSCRLNYVTLASEISRFRRIFTIMDMFPRHSEAKDRYKLGGTCVDTVRP